MPDPKQSEQPRKPVPPRNDFSRAQLSRHSRSNELQGRNPEYHYEYLSTSPDSPGYIGRKLGPHEIGTPMGGYAVVGAWEVCHSQTDKAVRDLEPRDDQGKPIDTVIRRGRQVLCRIPIGEYQKYPVADQADADARAKQYQLPDRVKGPQSVTTVAVSTDDNADHMTMLTESGHPFPNAPASR